MFKSSQNSPREILSDRRRIQQVVYNLLQNAIRFSPKGKEITVVLSLKKTNASVLKLQVIDNGIGIAERDIKKLFTMFGQLAAGRKINPNGLGTGLFVSQGICKALGGFIKVKSDAVLGQTTFTCYFRLDLPPHVYQTIDLN
jgi:signal transduction histidine kinase